MDNLPTGSIFVFGANLFTSFFFQFIGFLLTYLLATSHSARYGSRAGLGLTLIQYGFYSRMPDEAGSDSTASDGSSVWPPQPTTSEPTLLSTSPTDASSTESTIVGVSVREWMSFFLMTLGTSYYFLTIMYANPRLICRMVHSSFFHHWLLAREALGSVHSRF